MNAVLRRIFLCTLAVPATAQVKLFPLSIPVDSPTAGVSVFAGVPAAVALLPPAAASPSLGTSLNFFPAASAPALASVRETAEAAAAEPLKPAAAAQTPAALPALRVGAGLAVRRVNAFWDGFEVAENEDADVVGVAPEASARPAEPSSGAPFLTLRDRRLEPAFERAIALARSTKSGAKALDDAEAALDGRVLQVEVKNLGRNYGEWDYLDDRLRLDLKLFEPGRETDLAGTLAHELRHVAQHARGLPSNALELEIEAHLLDLAMMEELGLETRPNTFSRQLVEALAKSPEAFVRLLEAAVPGSPYLGSQSPADIQDQLEQDLDDAAQKTGARSQKLAAQIESDIALLKSKNGRATYAAFSKRVRAELTRRSAAARRSAS